MSFTAWVDVAIGLSVVYLGASLFVTLINEYIARVRNLRGRQLAASLGRLLDSDQVRKLLSVSPAMQPFFGTSKEVSDAPSYVDPKLVARLIVGGLAGEAAGDPKAQPIVEALGALPPSKVKAQLIALAHSAGDTQEALVASVSDWVDRSLTILGEGYKRHLQAVSFGVGLALAVLLNLDTIALTTHLYRDKDARDATVALGVQFVEKTDKATWDKCLGMTAEERVKDAACAPMLGLVEAVQSRNASLGKLPIGWSVERPLADQLPGTIWGWGRLGGGWLMTALALSLGAPFWFDLLNRIVNLRYGMRRPQVDGEAVR